MEVQYTPQTVIDFTEGKRLVSAFHETKLCLHELRDGYFRKIGSNKEDGEERGEALDMHPRNLEADMKYRKEQFSKLKFNFIEQETKEKFLKAIMQEPPLIIEPKDNKELELRNEDQKQILKNTKTSTEALTQQISSVANDVYHTHNKLKDKTEKASNMMEDIARMEAELTRICAEESKRSKLTLEEAQKILDDQTSQLQSISSAMDDRRTSITELQWKIDLLSKEVKGLGPLRTTAESFAAEAVRMARLKDERVEELCKWYTVATQGYWKMMGIQSMERKSEWELSITYKISEGRLYTLLIVLEPNTGKVVDAEIENEQINISDVVDIAKSQPEDLAFLIHEVLARLRI